MSDAPVVRAASIIRSHSATEVAIGFSTITCFPLRSNATDCGAWSAFGVDTMAASTSGSAASASQSVVTRGIPWRSANALSTLHAMVGHGDELVAVREDAARVEVLDPPAPEERDPGHPMTSARRERSAPRRKDVRRD